MRLFLHNPEADWIGGPPIPVTLVTPDGTRHRVRLRARSGAGKRVIGKIPGLTSREAAVERMGWTILIRRSDLPKPAADEFYVHDLIDLPVLVGERNAGKVSAIHPTDGDDILEVETPDGPVFVPFIRRFIVAVEVKAGRVRLSEDAFAPEIDDAAPPAEPDPADEE